MLYHCNIDIGGLGNNVFSYWWTRAFAFYFNLEYQFVIHSEQYINALPNTSEYIKHVLKSTMHGPDQYNEQWIEAMESTHSVDTRPVSKFTFLLPIHSEFTFSKYVMEQIVSDGLSPSEADRLMTEYDAIRMYFLSVLLSPSESSAKSPSEIDGDDHELMEQINAFRGMEGQQMFIPMHYPWDSDYKLFYLNDVFRESVVAPDTEYVFRHFKGSLHIEKMEDFGANDIVIHIRCGDIMSNGKYYSGFQTFDFYRQSLAEIMRRHNASEFSVESGRVFVLLQLVGVKEVGGDVTNPHAVRSEDDRNCQLFADELIPKMRELIVEPMGYSLHLISTGTLHEDYYRLMTAPNVICGTSTFCMAATLSNVNATVVIWPARPTQPGPMPMAQHYAVGNIVELENVWIRSTVITNKKMNGTQVARYVVSH